MRRGPRVSEHMQSITLQTRRLKTTLRREPAREVGLPEEVIDVFPRSDPMRETRGRRQRLSSEPLDAFLRQR